MGFQDKYLDKNARMYQGNSVKMFQESNAKTFQGKNVGMFQGRFKERNAEMYPGNSAIMFHVKNVETCPGNNVETTQDKSAAKLAMVANNYSQNIHGNREQPVVIIASPISILQNKFYVLFIVTSSFRLKQILVN